METAQLYNPYQTPPPTDLTCNESSYDLYGNLVLNCTSTGSLNATDTFGVTSVPMLPFTDSPANLGLSSTTPCNPNPSTACWSLGEPFITAPDVHINDSNHAISIASSRLNSPIMLANALKSVDPLAPPPNVPPTPATTNVSVSALSVNAYSLPWMIDSTPPTTFTSPDVFGNSRVMLYDDVSFGHEASLHIPPPLPPPITPACHSTTVTSSTPSSLHSTTTGSSLPNIPSVNVAIPCSNLPPNCSPGQRIYTPIAPNPVSATAAPTPPSTLSSLSVVPASATARKSNDPSDRKRSRDLLDSDVSLLHHAYPSYSSHPDHLTTPPTSTPTYTLDRTDSLTVALSHPTEPCSILPTTATTASSPYTNLSSARSGSVSTTVGLTPSSMLVNDANNPRVTKRRRKSSTGVSKRRVDNEDRILVRLKAERLSWKEIAARFNSNVGKHHQVPALQMRLKRLRERLNRWNPDDPSLLHVALNLGNTDPESLSSHHQLHTVPAPTASSTATVPPIPHIDPDTNCHGTGPSAAA